MAKRPRMGRNLDALLGGASTNRTARSKNTAPDSDSVAVQSAPDSDNAQNVQSEPVSVASESADEQLQPDSSTRAESIVDGSKEQLIMLGVEKIRRGSYQPRRLFDQALLQELADSIKAEGMIQPIIVRPFADGYELVAGERRWRASQLAGLDRIPAIVRSMEDQSVAAVSVIENIQRKDLNPLEEAAAFERLCDEFGMTHKAVAESVGRSRAAVTNLMRLLELHDEVKLMVDNGELEMGHARALLGAPRQSQPGIAARIVKQGMTVRAVEKYVRSLDENGNEIPAGSSNRVNDPDIERLSKKLSETLGAAVEINHKNNGGGKLQIKYTSVGELQGILAHIK